MKLVIYDDQYKVWGVIENVESYKVEPVSLDRRNIIINNGFQSYYATLWRCLLVDDDFIVQRGDVLDANLILEQVKKEKIKDLDRKCEETILSGFTIPDDTTYTNLIGNHYGFDLYDQLNFNMQMTYLSEISATEPIYWKTENKGVLPHTIDEFKEVCRYAERHKRGNIEKYWSLKEQVLNATSIEEIEAINW